MINGLQTSLSFHRLWVCLFTVGLFFDGDQHDIVKTQAVATIPKSPRMSALLQNRTEHSQIETKGMSDLPAYRQTHSFELIKFTADQKFAHFDTAIIIPSLSTWTNDVSILVLRNCSISTYNWYFI